jgi:hypothetical protein
MLPTMTAASLSQPPTVPLGLASDALGSWLPLFTHSLTASLTLSLLLLNVLDETPPLYMISCTLGDMFEASDRQK